MDYEFQFGDKVKIFSDDVWNGMEGTVFDILVNCVVVKIGNDYTNFWPYELELIGKTI